MMAEVGDGEVLLGRAGTVESLCGRSTGSTAMRWGSLAGPGWLEARWLLPGAAPVWCGAEAHDAKQSRSVK
jgi:hypothetical protein